MTRYFFIAEANRLFSGLSKTALHVFLAKGSLIMHDVLMRTDKWLKSRLEYLQDTFYADSRKGFPIQIRFGVRARYRFGSIYSQQNTCHILINRLFAMPEVPEYVVDATIVHELAHYVHGYGSGLRKLHANPHRGGIVDREMKKRGCFVLEEQAGKWREEHWLRIYEKYSADSIHRKQMKCSMDDQKWSDFFSATGYRSIETIRTRWMELENLFEITHLDIEIEWLKASLRHNGLSYHFPRENVIRLHGLLAYPSIPPEVVDYELCYWLAALSSSSNWSKIESSIRNVGLWNKAETAIEWRRKVWPIFLAANHPLRSK
jgi:hypothetical protein